MVKRIRLKLRQRLKLEPKKWVRIKQPERSVHYINVRYWLLHELRQLRARRKYGTSSIKDIKASQRALAKIRKDEG